MNEYEGHLHQKFGHISYSQHGEDFMFMNLAMLMKLDKPSYLDLGAYHPTSISNTALLYKNGSRGVNVEANPLLMDEFFKQRLEDKNVCVGVGPVSGFQSFYIENDFSVLNSFKKDSFENHNTAFTKTRLLKVMTLNEIVQEYCKNQFPDFLMLDIEDMDFEVLESADFYQSRPKIVCAEIKASESIQTINLMHSKRFAFVCRMVSNMIFVDRPLYQKCCE